MGHDILEKFDDLKDILSQNILKSEFKCEKCGKIQKVKLSILKNMFKFGKLWCRGCRCAFTMTQKYGYANNYSNKNTIEKIQTKRKLKIDEIVRKSKQTKKERYGNEKYVNSEKRKKTNLERYGKENFVNEEKSRQTKEERYGDEFFTNEEKRKQTCLKKYGTIAFGPQNKEKIIKKYGSLENFYKYRQKIIESSNKKNYGTKSTLKLKEIIKKSIETKIKKYGQEYPNFRSIYIYNNLNFDSSWELAYYIWLKDKKIDFEFKPKRIIYKSIENKDRFYYPDFKVNDAYHEIKGDHLIDKNNNIIDPFTKRIFKEKTELFKTLNIKIIKSKEIKPIINYIKEKYGQDYLQQFRRK